MLALVLTLLALTAGSALGKEIRVIESSFGGGELSLGAHSGIAVNDTSHNIYVADTGNSRIAEFKADGTSVGTFGSLTSPTFVAVDNSGGGSQGAVYVVDAADNSISKFTAAGAVETSWGTAGKIGGFGGIAGITVDQSGALFILEEDSTVNVYSSAGVAAFTFVAPRGTAVAGLAVDSEGNFYKVDGTPEVTEFDSNGTTVADNLTGRSDGVGLSINPGNNDLYVINGNGGAPSVSVFAVNCGAANCTPKESFGEGELSNPVAVTVDGGSGAIYVADEASGEIDSFGSPVTVPDLTAEAPSAVTGAKATLHGSVNPDGLAVTECKFEYGNTAALGESTPCTGTIPTDETNHPVTAAITGLSAGSTYYFRLAAKNAHGTTSSTLNFVAPERAVTKPATGVTATEATLNGAAFPEGEAISECFFEYGETESYGSTKDCTQNIPNNEVENPVSATITGLTPVGTTYHFRLVVKQTGGETIGGDQTFRTKGAIVTGERTLSVGVTEATVEAKINPRGSLTRYRFEYGLTESYGNSTQEAILSEGEELQTAVETIVGLSAETTYHWRVVAIDPFAEYPGTDHTFTTRGVPLGPETGCPNQAFRTYEEGQNLPDCRAYEQVSPTDKNGSNIQHEVDYVEASRDGDRFTFVDNSGLTTTGGSAENYVGSRVGDQWSTNGLVPAAPPGREAELLSWDEEIRTPFSSVPGSNLYFGDTATGTYEAQVPLPSYFFASVAGYAADTKHVVFESERALAGVPGATAGIPNVYDLDNGSLSLVDQIPAGAAVTCAGSACIPAPEGGFAGPYGWQDGGLHYGGASSDYYTQNTISSDGSREVFTAAGTGALYMREDGTKTTEISASKLVTPGPARPAAFVGAAPDDSQVFFLSCERLTEDSTAVSTAENSCTEQEAGVNQQGMDLYRYDAADAGLTDLTVDHTAGDALGAAVIGVLGVSESGSYIYFAANGVLGNGAAEGATPGTCTPEVSINTGSAFCNIYVEHEGTIKFVTRIDSGQGGGGLFNGGSENWLEHSASAFYGSKSARVSDNGVLIFISSQNLANYDPDCQARENGCFEMYRYQPVAEGLAPQGLHCVSCNPTGAAPSGDVALARVGAVFGGEVRTAFLTRNLSPDGDRIFFDTPDPLVAADTNGVGDPYEWEASGTGSCHSSSQDGGCLYILSTGTNSRPSFFGDASVSGNDAFIFTNQHLVPQDKDELTDAYDVRVDGGLASQNTTPGVPCNGEACLGGATTSPSKSTPGTANFSGPGNQQEKPKPSCKKGKKKCKKHHKKKHHKAKKSNGKQQSRTTSDDRGGVK